MLQPSSRSIEKENNREEEWNISASLAIEEEKNFDDNYSEELMELLKVEVVLTAIHQSTVNYSNDWIIDSGCPNDR